MAWPSGKGTVLLQHVGYRQVKVENESTYLRRTTALGDTKPGVLACEISPFALQGVNFPAKDDPPLPLKVGPSSDLPQPIRAFTFSLESVSS